MNIHEARNIAFHVGINNGHRYTIEELQGAFHRLDRSQPEKHNQMIIDSDRKSAQRIWSYLGEGPLKFEDKVEPMKVWIELPKVGTVEEAAAHCKAVNKMLNKAGIEGERFWATDQQRHCNTFYNVNEGPNSTCGYLECADRGHWFLLS